MKKKTCINDKNLPEGASVTEGIEYVIEKEFVNPFGQKAYIISGVSNEGMTSRGLRWYGYDAGRFADAEKSKNESKEYAFALN